MNSDPSQHALQLYHLMKDRVDDLESKLSTLLSNQTSEDKVGFFTKVIRLKQKHVVSKAVEFSINDESIKHKIKFSFGDNLKSILNNEKHVSALLLRYEINNQSSVKLTQKFTVG